MNLDSNFTCFTKFNSKSIIDVNANWEIMKTIKLIGDNIGENWDDLRCGDAFVDIILKTWFIKRNNG